MPITHNLLTSNADSANSSSYATAPISPGANRLVLAAISNEDSSSVATPTLSGCGLTWVPVASLAPNGIQRITVLRAMGASPSSEAVTIDFGGNVGLGCSWSIVEFDGVDTGGTNGSAAVVQSNTNSEEPDADQAFQVSLSAFGDAANRPYFAFTANRNATNTWVPEAGYTELHIVAMGSPNLTMVTAWRDDATDTSPSATLAISDLVAIGVALEIKAAAAAGEFQAAWARGSNIVIGASQ